MEFEYDVKENEILLKRCYGTEERIEVPAQIEGMPVTVLAPYIFSQARRKPDQKAAICGNQVKEIVLPDTVREIGNYAFYGCYYLEALTLSHRTHDIAGGAFTGCRHLKNLTFRMEQAEGYCMKDVLSEVHHEMKVKLVYPNAVCTLLFPEYYEEAVENTPARQLETQFHGSGYSYRQCFQDGVFQFGEYDRLFQEAQNLESEDFCIELAVTRLMEKARLSQDAEGVYQSYLMEHRMSAAGWCIEFEQNETLEFLTGFIDWQEEELSDLIEEANAKGRLEIQSVLMDYKHHHFGKKKKTFDL
ncbi:leucine-rich repeat protein [Jingyaoa shaoxingensis]|uniref:Leucine-rich repeat protein n=1 Tax=Jingyaoa shaoxingensis TaxID=2763671 RepID=A0ABR7NB26_9FIRM|nr:leucine-rich repeat protein [Jingyaoa shaoxingensis]MBC8573600.1 leucine-rich repeat protein [Jingyaoa shaoxingensis]